MTASEFADKNVRQMAKPGRNIEFYFAYFAFLNQGLASACNASSRSAGNFPPSLSPQIIMIRRVLLH